MAIRDNPYSAFNFMVRLGNAGGEDQIVGGFSDVTGLESEVVYYEYRNGNDKDNNARKIAGSPAQETSHSNAGSWVTVAVRLA